MSNNTRHNKSTVTSSSDSNDIWNDLNINNIFLSTSITTNTNKVCDNSTNANSMCNRNDNSMCDSNLANDNVIAISNSNSEDAVISNNSCNNNDCLSLAD